MLNNLGNKINSYIQDQADQYLAHVTDKVLKKVDSRINDYYVTPAKSRIDEFRSIIASQGGLQRTNQFIFNVSLPQFLRPTLIEDFSAKNFLTTQGLNDFDGVLGLLCQKIDVPRKSLRTTEIKVNGQRRVVPANYSWDDITVTFVDTNSCIVYNTMYSWMDYINNPVTNTGRFFDEYVTDLRVDYLNKNNEILGYIKLADAFPVSVSRSALSFDDRSTFMLTTVTFTYTYQSNRDYSSVMLYNMLNNLTDGAAASLLNKGIDLIKQYNPITLVSNSLTSSSTYGSHNGEYYLFTDPPANN